MFLSINLMFFLIFEKLNFRIRFIEILSVGIFVRNDIHFKFLVYVDLLKSYFGGPFSYTLVM